MRLNFNLPFSRLLGYKPHHKRMHKPELLKSVQLLLGGHAEPYKGTPQTLSELDADFAHYYARNILPDVAQYERKRIETLLKYRSRLTIAFPLALVFLFLQLLAHREIQGDGHFMVLIFAFMAYGALYFWSNGPVRSYNDAVKKEIFPRIFNYFGEDFTYHPEEGSLSLERLSPSGILPHYNIPYTEDFIYGTHKGVRLELMESTLIHEQQIRDKTHRSTTFRGMFILLSMHKPFKGRTHIRRERGAIGNWLGNKTASRGLKPVTLEDPRFEKQFDVYSDDQVEARYLLTPSFMERLQAVSELFDSAKIQASFFDNHLMLMIPSKQDRFETASIFTPATFEEDIIHILKEMQLIFGIIDTLKLYEDTRL